jgi:hypothetical protein
LRRFTHIRDSIGVSISACHAEDPGSIPGRGVLNYLLKSGFKTASVSKAKTSDTGTRTQVAWVKARYPNQLDYIGCWISKFVSRVNKDHMMKQVRVELRFRQLSGRVQIRFVHLVRAVWLRLHVVEIGGSGLC